MGSEPRPTASGNPFRALRVKLGEGPWRVATCGSVETTATRSLALVTAEKSMAISASHSVARPNGALRMM